MGWFGIVFKGDISRVSDYLAVGLATGYLGSLTTFSGWNQKMLDLSVQGKWALVVFGYPIGTGVCFCLYILIINLIWPIESRNTVEFDTYLAGPLRSLIGKGNAI